MAEGIGIVHSHWMKRRLALVIYGQCCEPDKQIVMPLLDFPTRKIASHPVKCADLADAVLPCGATCLCLAW
jgi:hypothetical protein